MKSCPFDLACTNRTPPHQPAKGGNRFIGGLSKRKVLLKMMNHQLEMPHTLLQSLEGSSCTQQQPLFFSFLLLATFLPEAVFFLASVLVGAAVSVTGGVTVVVGASVAVGSAGAVAPIASGMAIPAAAGAACICCNINEG